MSDGFGAFKRTVFDEVMRASREHVLTERVRAEVQEMVAERVRSGDIASPEDVESFVRALKAAVGVLERVSFDSWKLIAGDGL